MSAISKPISLAIVGAATLFAVASASAANLPLKGPVAPPVFLPGVAAANSWSDRQIGYVIGVGGEYMLTSNSAIRAGYMHYDLSGSSATLALVGAFRTADAACTPGACNWALNASRQNIDTGVVGISYKFGGPIAAKY